MTKKNELIERIVQQKLKGLRGVGNLSGGVIRPTGEDDCSDCSGCTNEPTCSECGPTSCGEAPKPTCVKNGPNPGPDECVWVCYGYP